MLNIVLFGPPGAGKGTQSEKLIEKYGLVHLSTGDIFRANIKGETELGTLAKGYMDKGELVPDEVTIRMLEQEVNKHSGAKGFIFDGFPRTSAQAEALDRFLESKGWNISAMLALEVEDEELKKRLLLRGKDSGRPDDQNPEIIANRIAVYNRDTAPLKTFYTAQGKYRGVYGIGSIDEIFGALCKEIDVLMKPAAAEKKPGFIAKIIQKVIRRKPKAAVEQPAAAKAKKAPAKPAAVKQKAAPKKAKPVAKKKTTKKAAPAKPKKVAKKTTVKKSVAKKTTAKKTIAKKTAAKKKVAAGKPKTAAKKATKKPVKKSAAKKATRKPAPKKTGKKAAKKTAKKNRR